MQRCLKVGCVQIKWDTWLSWTAKVWDWNQLVFSSSRHLTYFCNNAICPFFSVISSSLCLYLIFFGKWCLRFGSCQCCLSKFLILSFKRIFVQADKKEFFELMTPAWKGLSTVEIAQSGIRETGMFPVNYDAILQHAFEPSLTTDRPLPNTG